MKEKMKALCESAKDIREKFFNGIQNFFTDRLPQKKIGILLCNTILCMAIWILAMWGVVKLGNIETSQAIEHRYLIEIAQGFLFVFLTWLMTMYEYICLRQIKSHTKYAIEIFCISAVIVEGVAILLWAFQGTTDGTRAFFSSVYTALGSFTFEGLTDRLATTMLSIKGHEIINAEVLFYGWAVYAGLTFLGIITAKSNYEIYSRIKMIMLPEIFKDIYVFSALTEETLALAESIEKKSGSKSVIVFAGTSLKPFDRKDELCIQVMAKGYLYWSFTKGNKKSLDRALHLYNFNIGRYNTRFVVFAFATEKDVPAEEDNMDFVFSDIKKRIKRKKMLLGLDNMLRVEYYILTKRTINYPAYDYKNREFLCDYYDAINPMQVLAKKNKENNQYISKSITKHKTRKSSDDIKKYILSSKNEKSVIEGEALEDQKLKECMGAQTASQKKQCYREILSELQMSYADRFIINVWSEACAVAKDAARDSTELIQNRIKSWEEMNNNSSEQKPENKGQPEQKQANVTTDFNIWCLGFGSTAQEVAKALYAQASYIDENGKSPEVNIWAFDKKMDEIEGLFKMEHPCSIVGAKDTKNDIVVDAQIDAIANAKSISQDYIRKEMSYPIFHFEKWDCRSNDFLKKFDDAIGKTDAPDTEQPDVFVIAMGDDYANIRIANAIIQDTVNEAKTEKKQIIFVNVWDSKNNDLLLTCGGKKKGRRITINDNLDVYIIGNNEDVYSHQIVDVEKPSEYHSNYTMIGKFTGKVPGGSKIIEKVKNWAVQKGIKESKSVEQMAQHILDNIQRVIHEGKKCEGAKVGNDKIDAKEIEAAIDTLFGHLVASIKDGADMEKYVKEKLDEKELINTMNHVGVSGAMLISVFGVCNAMGNKMNKIKIYNSLDAWLKESNKLADIFAPVMASIIANPSSTSDYHRLSKIEHQRWCRVHWANGWIYENISYKDELKRHHHCLLPYNHVGNDDYLYDTINVLLALAKK